MRSSFGILAALPAVLAAPLSSNAPLNARSSQVIPGKYIVKLNDITISSLVPNITSITGAEPEHLTVGDDFKALIVDMSPEAASRVEALPGVQYIEQDQTMYASALTTQSGAPYGLGRISHRSKGYTSYVYDTSAGSGTYAYIIDTGIYTSHSDFGGRATFAQNFAGDGQNTDCNGHGTHVAGTVGSTTYGVAKKTNLIGVKVLDCDGSGSNSGVIKGINWAASDAKSKGRIGKAVANMSLGGSYSQSLNDAVASAVSAGLFFAVAAGNENQNAGNTSPASESSACTVGATDSNDARASFSNYGSSLDIFAPGVNILSTWNNGGTNTISGTSMASPHIAGLGAYLLGLGNSASGLCSTIQSLSTKNVVSNPGSGSVNALAYNGNGA